MRLELELARTQESTAQSQERLMQATNAIANLHGTGMVALGRVLKADRMVKDTKA